MAECYSFHAQEEGELRVLLNAKGVPWDVDITARFFGYAMIGGSHRAVPAALSSAAVVRSRRQSGGDRTRAEE